MSKTRIPKRPTQEELASLVNHKDLNIRLAIAERDDFDPDEDQIARGLADPCRAVVTAFVKKAATGGKRIGLSPEQIKKGLHSKSDEIREWFRFYEAEARINWENRLLRQTFHPLAKATEKPNGRAL